MCHCPRITNKKQKMFEVYDIFLIVDDGKTFVKNYHTQIEPQIGDSILINETESFVAKQRVLSHEDTLRIVLIGEKQNFIPQFNV